MKQAKRRVLRDGLVRWTKRPTSGNYGTVSGRRAVEDDNEMIAVINIDTPDWYFLDRRGCREMAKQLLACANDEDFWRGRVV